MLNSLRTKLIAAFAFIIFVCLISAGAAFVLFLRNHETEMAREHVGRLAEPLALRTTYLEWVGLTPEQMEPILLDYAERNDVRLLLVDKAGSNVIFDTEGRLEGQVVKDFETGAGTEKVGSIWVWQVRYKDAGHTLMLFTSLDRVPGREEPSASMFSRYRTVVAVPEEDITSAWIDVLPRLGFAGGIAFAISVAVALLLSRSISGPVGQMTRAAEAIAKGNYDQQIEVTSRDEVGRLAANFNIMASEVQRSQDTLRQFLADASHELRTPLTSIQGFSQAMVEGAVDSPEELKRAAGIINDEAQRMNALVGDLLELSRMEAGQAVLQREKIDLRELLRTTAERFQPQAEEKSISVSFDVPEVAGLEGDPRRLEQAFSNLLDNAVRHTPSSGTISVRAQVENGAVRVGVKNSGSVISEKHLPHLFERFYQVSKARNEGHAGLGLAIASEVVQAHGGRITVASSPADGTQFTVILPLNGAP